MPRDAKLIPKTYAQLLRAVQRVLFNGRQEIEAALRLPPVILREKLRLRGIDCPEIDTPAGKAAKRAAEALLCTADSITIVTSKPDKYDRYLADIFLTAADGAEIYLNHYLLAQGLAERKDAWEFSD